MDSKMESKRWPRRSKTVPRWAKMRTRHEKMSPSNVAIASRFAVFAKLEQFRGQEGPIMYLRSGYWTNLEPTDGKKSPNVAIVGVQKGAGGEDGLQNGFQVVAKRGPRRSKMGPRWAKMRPRREKMSPRNVAIAGRFAVSQSGDNSEAKKSQECLHDAGIGQRSNRRTGKRAQMWPL